MEPGRPGLLFGSVRISDHLTVAALYERRVRRSQTAATTKLGHIPLFVPGAPASGPACSLVGLVLPKSAAGADALHNLAEIRWCIANAIASWSAGPLSRFDPSFHPRQFAQFVSTPGVRLFPFLSPKPDTPKPDGCQWGRNRRNYLTDESSEKNLHRCPIN